MVTAGKINRNLDTGIKNLKEFIEEKNQGKNNIYFSLDL